MKAYYAQRFSLKQKIIFPVYSIRFNDKVMPACFMALRYVYV